MQIAVRPQPPTACRVCAPGAAQPGLPTRLVAGLLILKHMHDLSHELHGAVERRTLRQGGGSGSPE